MLDETGWTFREARWREDTEHVLGRDVGDMVVSRPATSQRGPATTAVIAGVATGISKDLIQRAADVTLKERRPLVFVPRETPLRPSTLRQMADLATEGAVILPGFYAGAKDVCELVDFIAAKVLDVIGVPHALSRRWAGQLGVASNSAGD
jgi:flavin prenyltransferase